MTLRCASEACLKATIAAWIVLVVPGCITRFDLYRMEGSDLYAQEQYGAARGLFVAAMDLVPENADNLCDLGACHVAISKEYMRKANRRAARRELDRAVAYYDRAIQSFPGHAQAVRRKNEALEMRGSFDEALQTAEWASSVIGPSAMQQLYLAQEYRERGDADRALLAYKQAVAMEPDNPVPHRVIGMFYLEELNDRQRAIEHLQESYRLDPRSYIADKLRELGADVPERFAEVP